MNFFSSTCSLKPYIKLCSLLLSMNMVIPSDGQVSSLLEDITRAGRSYFQHEQGARERLLLLAYSLAAAVELPSETIQRIGWAEVSCARAGGENFQD